MKQIIAREYHRDARHFLRRFDLLPQQEFDKMGRVKNFCDLYFAAECGLKAHIFAGRSQAPAIDLYRSIRKFGGHQIRDLATMADLLDAREVYDAVARRFEPFSVSLRYSLDAWATFFPFGLDEGDAAASYDDTVANATWLKQARDEVERLIEAATAAVTVVRQGIDAARLVAEQGELKEFVKTARIRR